MLKVTCPITGFKYTLAQFATDKTHNIKVLHPLLQIPLPELVNIPIPYKQDEKYILFCAYLYQINQLKTEKKLIIINSPPNPKFFHKIWFNQKLPEIINLSNWIYLNISSSFIIELPTLRIDNTMGSIEIQNWLDGCNKVKDSYEDTLTIRTRLEEKLFKANTEEKFWNELDNYKPTKIIERARFRRDFVEASFSHCTIERINLIKDVIFRPQSHEVTTIKQVRELCLDFLLESRLEDWNEKQDIIKKLDQVLVDKLSILSLLDPINLADLDAIKDQYTIEISGTKYKNSVLDSTSFDSYKIKKQKPLTEKPVYTSEPKREDFPNELRYKIALNIWKGQKND